MKDLLVRQLLQGSLTTLRLFRELYLSTFAVAPSMFQSAALIPESDRLQLRAAGKALVLLVHLWQEQSAE